MEMSGSQPSQFIMGSGNNGISGGSGAPLIDDIEIGVPERKSWKILFAYMGPGFLVSIAYIDPGNWKHLAEHCRAEYTKGLNFMLWILAELAVVACDIPEGNWSSKLFPVALLASGQSSTITGTYAGQYVMQGFLDLRITPWIRNLLTRSLAIVPSLIAALIGGPAAAGKFIIIASMILSFELPFALVPLLKFTSSESKMGSYANSSLVAAITWMISSLIVAINSYHLGTGFVNLLLHGGMQTVTIVLAGIFGFSGMLIYVAAILYLVFRRNRHSTQPLLQDHSQIGYSCGTRSSSYDLPREDIASMQLPQRRVALDLG